MIDEEQGALVERLLCEEISLRGICRTIGVSTRWLMDFMVARFAAVPARLHISPVAASRTVLFGSLKLTPGVKRFCRPPKTASSHRK